MPNYYNEGGRKVSVWRGGGIRHLVLHYGVIKLKD